MISVFCVYLCDDGHRYCAKTSGRSPWGIWGETTRICEAQAEMLVSYKPLAPQLTALFVAVLAVYGSDDSDSDALACLLALRTHMHGLKHA